MGQQLMVLRMECSVTVEGWGRSPYLCAAEMTKRCSEAVECHRDGPRSHGGRGRRFEDGSKALPETSTIFSSRLGNRGSSSIFYAAPDSPGQGRVSRIQLFSGF